eukprot:CAMPEP_0115196876 /NCGR_PEP_ID=MMETSP0270-20121206/15310_1 /TAXON_ID=71861 /ORGANISM="Scrippsiella trochoidea, Strain CCMP3099" /LENGTH=361 /DNA_ID=CAMNT_0002610219 /DNA_START=72 /DNA_END=1157 /DNA_ORIENTATION=-
MRHIVLLSSMAAGASACSNFYMNYTNPDYRLSGRSEDMAYMAADVIHSFPRGRVASPPNSTTWTAKYGFVGFCGPQDPFVDDPKDNIYDGLNEMGLSCSSLTMFGTKYAKHPGADPTRNLYAPFMCRWVLENFATVEEAKATLAGMHVFARPGGMKEHFYLADEHRHGLVVEFMDGKVQLTLDMNDGGKTGLGIFTNSPPFGWQLQAIKHFEWKRSLAKSSVAIPGTFYPDDRFLRMYLFREAIESGAQPMSYREAVARVVSILNTVAVPPGGLSGTGGLGDHSKWQVVRDHKNRKVYWRALDSPSLQLIDLKKLAFAPGSPVTTLSSEIPDTVWYRDVTSQMISKFEHSQQHASNTPMMV